MLAPDQLTTHQAPALLIAALEEAAADGSSGRTRLLPGLQDLLQLSEACAQSVAVVMGYSLRQEGDASAARGMLVGLKDVRLLAQPAAEQGLFAQVRRILEMPPFSVFTAEIFDDQTQPIMEGEIKVVMAQAGDSP